MSAKPISEWIPRRLPSPGSGRSYPQSFDAVAEYAKVGLPTGSVVAFLGVDGPWVRFRVSPAPRVRGERESGGQEAES
jgi:hypothetical protein